MSVEWVRLRLDLASFDDAEFRPYLQQARDSGLTFPTLAEIGDTMVDRRALYELNKTCSSDIPERGDFYTFEQYLEQRIDTPTFDPRGVVLALEGNAWVGFATTSIHPDGDHGFSEMTGVLRSHRGRGMSLALKLLAVGFTRDRGMGWLRTFHHPRNASAIAMNRRLGFVDDPPDRLTWAASHVSPHRSRMMARPPQTPRSVAALASLALLAMAASWGSTFF